MTSRSPHPAAARAMALVTVVALLLAALPAIVPSRASAQQAPGCLGWTNNGHTYMARRMQYTSDTAGGALHLVGCGEVFTPTDILSALQGGTIVGAEPADAIQLVDPVNKTWMLNVRLTVEEGATLNLVGGSGDTNWMRLKSGAAGIVNIRAENSTLLIKDTKVSSWDPSTGTYDTTNPGAPGTDENPGGGTKPRAFIVARSNLAPGRAWTAPTACGVNGGTQDAYEARMDVINSSVDHLGYHGSEAYGISWKVFSTDLSLLPPNSRELYNRADVFGTISNSTFSQNYFGAYTFGAYCMDVTGNSFSDNYYYGFDPHDDSDYLTVSGNTFARNPGHGFICSVYCDHLVLTNNQALDNGKHGLMIHRRTDGARIEGNTVRGNGENGLAIFDSYGAVVRNNTIEDNGISAVRLSVGASNNLIENNTLTGIPASSAGNGYVIYSYMGSDLPTTGDNRRMVKNTFRGNTITGFKSPVVKFSDATGNLFEDNVVDTGAALTTFEFRDGQGNIVLANTPSGLTTLNTTRSAADQPVAGTILSEPPLGKSVVVKNAAGGATTTVRDARSHVWQGSPVRALPTGTSGTLSAATTTITPLDFVVKPSANAVTVTVPTWATSAPYSKSWTETAPTNPGAVHHEVGNLAAGSCYQVKAGTASLGGFVATGSGSAGRIAFAFTGQYPETQPLTFTVAASTTACLLVTPTATATTVPGTGSIQLSKAKSKYNGVVTATISGMAANTSITLTWPQPYEITATGPNKGTFTDELARGQTDGSGRATLTFRTPLEPLGNYPVTAKDAAGTTATTTLRVIPRILLNETAGPTDTNLRVYFYGFAPGEQIDVRWHSGGTRDSSYQVLKRITVADNGRASSLITIPSKTGLGDRLIVGQVVGVARSASTTFTVTSGSVGASERRSSDATATMTVATPTMTVTPTPEGTVEPASPTAETTIEATVAPTSPTAEATFEPTSPTAEATFEPTTEPTSPTTEATVETATAEATAEATVEPTSPTAEAATEAIVETSPEATAVVSGEPADTSDPAAAEAPATAEPSVEATATATTAPAEPGVVPVVGVRRSANAANGWTALDGDPSTVWATTDEPPGRIATLTLDLGAPVAVDGVRILVAPDGFEGMLTVEVSNDMRVWTAVARPSAGALAAGESTTLAFDAPAEVRYVRLVVVNPGDLTTLGGVGEIEVLGPN